MSTRKIEDIINEILTGDIHRNALDFAAYLRVNDVSLDDSDNNFWNGVYKDKGVCCINIYVSDKHGMCFDIFMEPPRSWITSLDGEINNENMISSVDERTKKIVWANIRPCDPTCGGGCSLKRIGILGKEFENVCKSILGIYNPNAETVDCMKRIIDGLKSDILVNAKST